MRLATPETTTRSFLCPCCRKILFSFHLQAGAARWVPTADSPPVRYDRTGPFIKCGYCTRRVAIVLCTEDAEEPFFLAVKQDCRQIVPD